MITIAAPNKGYALQQGVEESVIVQAIKERIQCALCVAREHDCEILMLGAFGCGAFKNDPREVAGIFKKEMLPYQDMELIFPIPSGGKNYDVFSDVLLNE